MEKQLQFRLLGPVEAWDGDRPVRLQGPRQRIVLATLALQVGRSVAPARLVDAVWGDDPPTTAKQQVYSSISALRRALPDAIVTTALGYKLSTAPEQVDACQFEAKVNAARQDAPSDPRRAARRLREALALWRGPALSGMPGLAAPAARLEERRLTVLEERIELDLRTGRHADVVAELAELIDDHPTRERLIAQLMLAYYRSGRQADALEAYRLAEQRLVADLGLNPGAELRQVRLAILRADPALTDPTLTDPVLTNPVLIDPVLIDPDRAVPAQITPGASRHAATPQVAPAQLPPDVADFTGRARELRALAAMLADQGSERSARSVGISTIIGTAGVGKTAMAVHWAHQIRDRYPDGQFHINLRGHASVPPLRAIDALARFLHALGVAPEQVPIEVDEASAMYRTLLAGRQVLVLLDNASSAEQVRPLLPGGAGCLVVITSREQLAGLVALDGARRLTLDRLTPGESAALLARILGERVWAEPDASAELARLCAHLPLALRIAAANLLERPYDTIASYTSNLRTTDRLTALELPGDEQAAVRATFALSYTGLAEAARRLFRLLALLPGADVTAPAAAALAGTSQEEAEQLLHRLAAAHLVQECAPDRFTCHELLQLYAAEQTNSEDSEANRRDAATRLFDHYLRSVHAAARLLYPHVQRLPFTDRPASASPTSMDSDTAALAWLDAERENLLAVIRRAAATDRRRSVAWRLADGLRGYFWLRMQAVDWLAAASAGLSAAEQDGQLDAQAAAKLSIGDLHWRQGRHGLAIDHYNEAAKLAESGEWVDGRAAALGSLGSVHRHLGQLSQAAHHTGLALNLYQQASAPAGVAAALDNLGIVRSEQGRLREAAAHHGEALALRRRLRSRAGEAMSLVNLAEVHHRLGRLDLALEELTEALRFHREISDIGSEAETLRVLADVHGNAGRHDRALELATDALNLARESEDRRYEVDSLNTLAVAHGRLGGYRRAVDLHEEARLLAREVGDRYTEVEALIGLATNHRHLGDCDQALAHINRALTASRKSEFRMLHGQALTALASIRLDLDDHERAIADAEQALVVHRETGHLLGEARTHLLLGHALRDRQADKAVSEWQLARSLFTEVGARVGDDVTALLRGHAHNAVGG